MDENKSFKCNVPGCEKAFWFKSALTRHLKRHKEKEDPDAPAVTFGCSDCPKQFAKIESLRRHYRTTHGNVYVYPCEYEGCNQMFQRRDNLTRHAASHSENKNNCDVCGKSFARKDALTRHKRIHTRKVQSSKNTKNGRTSTQDNLNTTSDEAWTLKCDEMIFQIDVKKEESKV
ncbi:zinc finger protein 2-like isoform X2 [Drosophila innubila]|uniref:zinc finger protein 2-like isoform X2 n=1 Tax=Drosophila innubila TaxID=198719 RepID=UPI00148CA0EC|nr:zinc finger protein 2-like isoform X2 [Drosophila innubila]